MGLRDRMKRLEGELAPERVILLTEDGEEIPFSGDPLELVVEWWSAAVERRPVEHPLAPRLDRGLRLKDPERVIDPLWKTLYGE